MKEESKLSRIRMECKYTSVKLWLDNNGRLCVDPTEAELFQSRGEAKAFIPSIDPSVLKDHLAMVELVN